MPIAVLCPSCESRLNAPDAAAGKTLKCPKCKEPMVIPEAEPVTAGPGFETVEDETTEEPAGSSDIVVEDEDERPRKKPLRDEGKPKSKKKENEVKENEGRPRKKGKGKSKAKKPSLAAPLLLGIAGAILLVVGVVVMLMGPGSDPPKASSATGAGSAPPPGMQPTGAPGSMTPPSSGGGSPLPVPAKVLIAESSPRDRALSSNNLKQIALAFHNFQGVNKALPMGVCDSTGKLGLSWRVAILPYIEQAELYKKFQLNEPWDSERNKALISQMPRQYAPPGNGGPAGMTYYRTFTGKDTPFPPLASAGKSGQLASGLSLLRIRDGASNTALIVEAGEPVIWTKPDELVYSAGGALPSVGGIFGDGVHVAWGDGSTAFLRKQNLTAEKLKALITATGGETINARD